MSHPLAPVTVWVVRLPGPGSDARVVGRATAVDPWAAVGPAALLDEDPARLAVLVDAPGGPAAVGVLGVHAVGADDGALLELSAPVGAAEVPIEDLLALADDPEAPPELRAYARLAAELEPEIRPGVLPGPIGRANILCILFPRLKICRAQKR